MISQAQAPFFDGAGLLQPFSNCVLHSLHTQGLAVGVGLKCLEWQFSDKGCLSAVWYKDKRERRERRTNKQSDLLVCGLELFRQQFT